MLRSDLCDYSGAYIVVKGRISVTGTNNANRRNKKLTFKDNAPFRSCITKINNTFTDHAEDTDIAIPMYNLLEYHDNFSMTSGSLWNYYRDAVNDANENNAASNCMLNKNKTTKSKSFKHKTKIIGSTSANNSRLDVEAVVPLKYLNNFWKSLDLSLISCEIELDLRWAKNCLISEVSRTAAVDADNPVEARTTNSTFQINNTKLYVPVATLSRNNNIKFPENIK